MALLATLSGCATNSLFVSYPSQAQKWKATLGNEAASLGTMQKLEKATAGGDGVLYLQELGRVAQLNGQGEVSRNAFADAVSKYDAEDASAKIQVSSLAASGTSLLTNDNARPYVAPDYERIFTRAYQAMNYWAENDVTGTAVELRAAALEQRVSASKREKEIAKAEEKAQENDVDVSQFDGYFEGIDAVAGDVKASFQNAWTFYLSALFWEAHGEYNDALVDYKKALEIHSGIDMIKEDVERVSNPEARSGSDEGMVAVLYEQGFVHPGKSSPCRFPLSTGCFPWHSRPMRLAASHARTACECSTALASRWAKPWCWRMWAAWPRKI